MFTLLADIAYQRRWAVLAVWVVLLLASGVVAPRVFGALGGGGFELEGTESDQGLELLQRMGRSESTLEVVFQREDVAFSDPAYRRGIDEALARVRGLPDVVHVEVPFPEDRLFVSEDAKTVVVLLWLDAGFDEAQRLVPDIRQALQPVSGQTALVTGTVAIFHDIEVASERDLQRGELVSMPLVLALLLFVFGTVVAALLPIGAGLAAVAVTLAVVYLLATQAEMSTFTVNIATFLGLGAAIDYSLLLVSRFREELAHSPAYDALQTTMDTAGRALFFSAVTTALGMAGLLIFDLTMLRSIAIGGVLVVLASALAALTLTPALLALLGPRVNMLPVLPRRTPRAEGLWRGIASAVMRRPVLVAVPVAGLLVLAGLPFLRVELGAPSAKILPDDYESRQGWDVISREFGPGYVSPIIVAVESQDSIFAPDSLRRLKEFTSQVAADPRVVLVQSLVDLHPLLRIEDYVQLYADPDAIPDPRLQEIVNGISSDRITFVRVVSAYEPSDSRTKDLVQDIRAIQPKGPELTAMTSGLTAGIIDSVDALYSRFPWAVAVIVGAIYVALLFLFRSLVLPAKAVLMNALSIFASYGALVFIFQEGRLEWLLGVPATGQTEATIPILLFFILFGISMDYEVFLLSRMKEAYERTGDNTSAVAEGLERTGRIITSAALVVILVSLGFATGDLLLVKALALGLAIAIALDVTVVRSLMVPALMRLLGDWNWWAPKFLRERKAPDGGVAMRPQREVRG
jgi:RND superfamily putative drug exporter